MLRGFGGGMGVSVCDHWHLQICLCECVCTELQIIFWALGEVVNVKSWKILFDILEGSKLG